MNVNQKNNFYHKRRARNKKLLYSRILICEKSKQMRELENSAWRDKESIKDIHQEADRQIMTDKEETMVEGMRLTKEILNAEYEQLAVE